MAVSGAVSRQFFNHSPMKSWFFNKASAKGLPAIALTGMLVLVLLSHGSAQTYSNVAGAKGLSIQSSEPEWGGGVNFFDYNRDGEDDLTYSDSLTFYTNNQGSLVEKNFLQVSGNVNQVLWFDFDNDGDNDLFITYRNRSNVMYENTGGLNFRKMTKSEIDLSYINESFGVSVCDYNKDGYLDIYVANYHSSGLPSKPPDTSKFNKLYRNNGDGTFTEVGVKVGVADGVKPSFQGIWIDYNDDGWQDLYVINDLNPGNSLYRNNGDGTFTEVTIQKNVGLSHQHPMSATAGDMDNNGALDIYMSNSFLNSGGRYRDGLFLKNDGKGNYREKGKDYGINIKKWSWGCTWVDYNNDTYQDLYVTTGRWRQPYLFHKNYFYESDMGDTFRTKQSAFVDSHKSRSFSVAKGDLNNDGYNDLFVQNNKPKEAQLWKNSGGSNHYIKTTLEGTASNRMGIGSWIHVYVDTFSYHKYTKCGQNFLSQNSQHKIFGLDTATKVDSVVVEYLSGIEDRYYDLKVDTHYYFTEGETTKHISFDTLKTLCRNNDSIVLSIESDYDSISWSTNDTNTSITITDSGKYWVDAWTDKGVLVPSDTVKVLEIPRVNSAVTKVSCHGKEDGKIKLMVDSLATKLEPEFRWNDTNQTTNVRDSLSAGHYPYTYSDSTGCRVKDTIEVTEPSPLNIQTQVSFDQHKRDSAARLNAVINGGSPPYQEFLDGDSLQTPVKHLAVDTYRYEVRDTNGCRISKEVAITRDSVPSIAAKVEPTTCYDAADGRITLQIDSFPGRQFQLRWRGGYRGRKLSGLSAGQYVYRYSDDAGAQYTDTVKVPRPDSIRLNPVVRPQTLHDLGSIKLRPSGGTPPYKIRIDGRRVDSALRGIAAGTYSVIVSDSQGCHQSGIVKVKDQRKPELEAQKTPVSCFGGADGSIKLKIDSLFYRNRDFSIRWRDGARGNSRQALTAGRYAFRYKDQKGIVVRDTVKLPEPGPVRYQHETASGNGEEGCEVNIRITGGTEPYSIQWDRVYRANPVTDVEEGLHHLHVTDQNGCRLDTSVRVRKISSPEIDVNSTPASCAGSKDGSVQLRLEKPVDSSIRMLWSDGYEGKVRDSLKAGTYRYTALTESGCRYRDSVEVEAPFELDVQYRIEEMGVNAKAIVDLVINGGTRPYTIYLDGSRVEAPIDAVRAGSHTLKVKDARNCVVERTIQIEKNEVTGLGNVKKQAGLHVYPVPVKRGKCLWVETSGKWQNPTVKLISTSGTVLYQSMHTPNKGNSRIKTSGLKAGVYLLKIRGSQDQDTIKVVVYE
jgi:hypothetical protein